MESALSQFSSSRARRQLGLFLGGASFFAVSAFITRRSLSRRYAASRPSFYQPSQRRQVDGQASRRGEETGEANGAMEAFEALNIATINVTSFAMMLTGGMLWVFDISSLADMRTKVRAAMGVLDRDDNDADEEMEEWLATVLARRDEKEAKRKKAVDERDRSR